MSGHALAHYVRRIRLADSVPALHELADEIEQRFAGDEASPLLRGVIGAKGERLTRMNGIIE